MTDRVPTRRHIRSIPRAVCGALLLCALLAVGVITVGCGGESSHSGSTTTTRSTVAVTSTVIEDALADLATNIADTWTEAMQELVALLEDKPEVEVIQPQVESLKEEYIQRFVAYGWEREGLSDEEKDEVDSLTQQALFATGSEPWFESYTTLYDYYAAGDLDFAILMASFDIMTQYAFFDLLKTQSPSEAARLGIE
jgi:hypothetical protein